MRETRKGGFSCQQRRIPYSGLRFFLLAAYYWVVCCQLLPTCTVEAFLCDTLEENTWAALTRALESSQGFRLLCPFEIRGNGCPATAGLGYIVSEDSSLILLCEQDVFASGGSGSGSATTTTTTADDDRVPACVIDCPGNHFTIARNATLTLDGITLRGSQTASSIYMQSTGELQAFGSTFENNINPSGNGAAIHAGENTKLIVNQCHFTNNTALNGGGIYAEGNSQITDSQFVDNLSTSTTSMAGGGALTIGVFAETIITDCYFDGNEAMNSIGAVILDHSTGLNTFSTDNMGCYNLDAGMSTTPASCNGIELSRSADDPCREFEEPCVLAAKENSTPIPTQSPLVVSNNLPVAQLTLGPSVRPSSLSLSIPKLPNQNDEDPCLEDLDSFECSLQELLAGEDTP